MNREQRLAWIKNRAKRESDSFEAITSLISDLGKYQETRDLAEQVGNEGMELAMEGDAAKINAFIERIK